MKRAIQGDQEKEGGWGEQVVMLIGLVTEKVIYTRT
jgi:hypothetical protein